MGDERRRARRYRVWLPMRVEADGATLGIAVSHDVSTTGVLMGTADAFEVGKALTITFQGTPKHPEEQRATGKIVRVDANEVDPHGLWPYRVAVEFESAVPELASILEETDL